jgi:L-ascorbate metabolism protein UlaG (beta-lactamase superfamily)
MNELKITLIGEPSALIEVGGFRLLIDPVFASTGECGQQCAKAVGTVDALLLSDDRHAHNVGQASRPMLAHAAWVLTTVAGADLLGAEAEGLEPWETRELFKRDGSSIRITATPAREGRAGIEPFAVDAIGFVITSPNRAFRPVYITGEATWYEGVAEVQRRFQPGLALLLAGPAQARPCSITGKACKANQATSLPPQPIMAPPNLNSWAYCPQQCDGLDGSMRQPSFGTELRKLSAGVTTSFHL